MEFDYQRHDDREPLPREIILSSSADFLHVQLMTPVLFRSRPARTIGNSAIQRRSCIAHDIKSSISSEYSVRRVCLVCVRSVCELRPLAAGPPGHPPAGCVSPMHVWLAARAPAGQAVRCLVAGRGGLCANNRRATAGSQPNVRANHRKIFTYTRSARCVAAACAAACRTRGLVRMLSLCAEMHRRLAARRI